MENMANISWSDFEKIDIRAGTVIDARVFEGARKPALQLWVDFGPLGILKSSAQIAALYTPDSLVGRQVVAVVNFPRKQIGSFMSECLVLGVYNPDNNVVLLHPGMEVQNGGKIG